LADIPERAALLFSLIQSVGDYALARTFELPIRQPEPQGASRLTNRETQVLSLICQGLSNAEIAKTLWIEESTAKVHVRNVLRKLRVRTRTEAAVLASQEGLVDLD
jgi:DNA-binding NarL/FixJ family response regulator